MRRDYHGYIGFGVPCDPFLDLQSTTSPRITVLRRVCIEAIIAYLVGTRSAFGEEKSLAQTYLPIAASRKEFFKESEVDRRLGDVSTAAVDMENEERFEGIYPVYSLIQLLITPVL